VVVGRNAARLAILAQADGVALPQLIRRKWRFQQLIYSAKKGAFSTNLNCQSAITTSPFEFSSEMPFSTSSLSKFMQYPYRSRRLVRQLLAPEGYTSKASVIRGLRSCKSTLFYTVRFALCKTL